MFIVKNIKIIAADSRAMPHGLVSMSVITAPGSLEMAAVSQSQKANGHFTRKAVRSDE